MFIIPKKGYHKIYKYNLKSLQKTIETQKIQILLDEYTKCKAVNQANTPKPLTKQRLVCDIKIYNSLSGWRKKRKIKKKTKKFT